MARIDQAIVEINAIAGSIAAAVKRQEAATAEIARNVVETAEAANEITGRTSDASREAADTGRHAVDLRDSMSVLDHAVEELRHSVIKVVRISTAEVDRRQTRRCAVDIAGGLSMADQGQYQVRASDLAEGGACVSGAPNLAAGSRGTLRLDGVPVPLPLRCAFGGRRWTASGVRARRRSGGGLVLCPRSPGNAPDGLNSKGPPSDRIPTIPHPIQRNRTILKVYLLIPC